MITYLTVADILWTLAAREEYKVTWRDIGVGYCIEIRKDTQPERFIWVGPGDDGFYGHHAEEQLTRYADFIVCQYSTKYDDPTEQWWDAAGNAATEGPPVPARDLIRTIDFAFEMDLIPYGDPSNS
mgnify:CR=1 FL=1|tara:strand:- start:4099 stop:4476 length:378 start_codon:yes stop_codon:yes gene_type:complete